MRLITYLAFLLLLAPAAAAAQAQPAIVTGRVMLLDSARGVARAQVRIDALSAGVSADSTGRYRLVVPARRIVAGDSVQVTASRMGLHPQRRWIVLAPGAEVRIDFLTTIAGFDGGFCGHSVETAVQSRIAHGKLCTLTGILQSKIRLLLESE